MCAVHYFSNVFTRKGLVSRTSQHAPEGETTIGYRTPGLSFEGVYFKEQQTTFV